MEQPTDDDATATAAEPSGPRLVAPDLVVQRSARRVQSMSLRLSHDRRQYGDLHAA
jgi:hypothetical protein